LAADELGRAIAGVVADPGFPERARPSCKLSEALVFSLDGAALRIEARARLNSFDFSPRLDDGEEFYGILFRADFYVAEAIDEPLDEAPLPDRTVLHASEEGRRS